MATARRFQFSLKTLLAEVFLAGLALGVSRLLFSLDGSPARLLGYGVLLCWLVAGGALVLRSWRAIGGWGSLVSSLFVIVGGPHVEGPLLRWIAESMRTDPGNVLRLELVLFLTAGILFIAAEWVRPVQTQAWIGLAALISLAGFVVMLQPNRYLDAYKLMSLAPVLIFGVMRGSIDVAAVYGSIHFPSR